MVLHGLPKILLSPTSNHYRQNLATHQQLSGFALFAFACLVYALYITQHIL